MGKIENIMTAEEYEIDKKEATIPSEQVGGLYELV